MDLRTRITGLFTDPKAEWTAIAAEPADIASIYRQYIAIVAAVPSLALLVRYTLAAAPALGLSVALGAYLAALAHSILAALVIERLAPKFRASGDTIRTLKLVAYSSAPVWLAGIFYLIPGVGGLATMLGVLYGIYLFGLGLPRVLTTPREQVVPFMLVSAIVLLVINIVLRALLEGARSI